MHVMMVARPCRRIVGVVMRVTVRMVVRMRVRMGMREVLCVGAREQRVDGNAPILAVAARGQVLVGIQ